jgi:hypothetical protein
MVVEAVAVAPPPERETVDRDQDLLGRQPRGGASPKSGIRGHLDDLFDDIKRGFGDQEDRSDDIQDYWDCYNCEANQHRYYNGIANIYFPIIHDAVEALVTRYVNQLFPQGGRYVQAISADGDTESALVAILDHYIRQGSVKTQVAEPLVRNGQVEGQYSLYVDWAEVERQIVSRETHGPIDPETGQEMPGEEIEDITEETIIEGYPVLEVLHDPDVLILPATADTVQEALSCGGSVTIVRRWSKDKIRAMARAGNIREDEADKLTAEMSRVGEEERNTERHILEQVGIRDEGRMAQVWEVWAMLPLGKSGRYAEDGRKRLCRIFFGPKRCQLGAKRNPYWNDRCPLISRPVKKMAGAAKGPSPIKYVESLQYEANDAVNEGADAATLSAAPIVARDPEKVDGPLVYNVGAVWDAPPGSVELLTFPDLTPRAATRVQMALQAIFQNLNVNPSMLPSSSSRTTQPTQAQIAQEQAVDLLTTAMGVSTLEDVLTEAVAWIVDLDYQFRDRDILIRMFGEQGRKAEMQSVSPLQNRNGLTFIWRGGEQVRQNAAFAQGGTAMINTLMQPSMQQLLAAEGLRFTPGEVIAQMITNQLGPEMGQSAIQDVRDQLTIPQDRENVMLVEGFEVPVHPLDNDEQHIPVAMQAIQETGDPHGTLRVHLQAHLQQRAAKIQAQMMQQMAMQQQGQPPRPGLPGPGGPGRPPGAQPPAPGSQPAGPQQMRGPNGMVHPDQMSRAGGIGLPRNM